MRRVLGVDAAWTDTKASGIALATVEAGQKPKLECVARSYVEAELGSIDWHKAPARASGEPRGLASLLKRFAPIHAVALDIPLATIPITGRRPADNEISRRYGRHGASTHTPSAIRPGPVSARHFGELTSAELRFATTGTLPEPGIFLETYPHPAIIELMGLDYRLPYKSKRARYWPEASPEERLGLVAIELDRLRAALSHAFDGVEELVPLAVIGHANLPRRGH